MVKYIIAAVSLFLIGIGTGMVAMQGKARPCVAPAIALEYPHVFTCLSFNDNYVCNVNGKAMTYTKDGARIPSAPKTITVNPERDSGCDTNPPTKYCAGQATAVTIDPPH